jgi:class 3 adenylate cyclase
VWTRYWHLAIRQGMEDSGGSEGYGGMLSEVTRAKGVVRTSRWEICKDGFMRETKLQNTGRRRSQATACGACAARDELRVLSLQRYRVEDCHSSEFEPWGDEPKLEFVLVDITTHQADLQFVCTSAMTCQEWVSGVRLMNGTYVFDMITRYVPNVLLQRLANDESLTQPSLDEFNGALLFTDISGFTALSEKLSKEYGPEEGSEELNRAINAFFQKMINVITKHGGDIIKFAGDAMFVVWQCGPGMDLRASVLKACQCAAALEEFNGDRVAAGRAHVALSLHMGLGAGDMMGLTVGDSESRQEYVIAGETIKQVSDAEGAAADGQTVLSSRALSYVEPQFASLVRDDGMGVLDTEAMRMQYGSSPEAVSAEGFEVGSLRNATTARRRYLELLRLRVQETEFAKSHATDQLRCFVPASVREVIDAGIYDSLGGLRPLTTMFVSIAVSDGPSDSVGWLPWLQYIYSVQLTVVGENSGTISRLQIDDKGVVTKSIFGLAGQNTESAMSALQAAFAIRDRLAEPSSVIPGMGQGLRVKVGVATGTIFAGVVGSAERCEYTSVGFTVNLAARLMQHAAKTPNRVVCDHPTKVSAELEVSEWREGTFGEAQRIQVKGAKDGMDVYFPSTLSGGASTTPHRPGMHSSRDEEDNEMTNMFPPPTTESSAPDADASSSSGDLLARYPSRPSRLPSIDSKPEAQQPLRTLHGRDAEIALLNDAVADLAPDTHSRLLLLTGTTGSGKTAMIENVIRQAAAVNDAHFFTGSGRSAGGFSALSLGCFRSTLSRVLAAAYREWSSNSVPADRESYQQYLRRRLQQATGSDGDSSRNTSSARSLGSYEAAKFLPLLNGEGVLPSENGIPLKFTTLDQTEHLSRFTFGNLRESRLLAVTSHLLDVFMQRPAVIAIDDAQFMDERSFHLCRELLSSCSGVMLVICYKTYIDDWGSDSSEEDVDILGPFLSEDTQTMDFEPFVELVAQYAAVSAEIELKPLTPEGARQLAAVELGVSQTGDDLDAFIEKRCHGIPNDIIEWVNMLRDQRIITIKDDQCATDVPGILEDAMLMSKLPATGKQRALAKIDSCNVTLRMITNYASVCHRITLQTLLFIVPTMRTANNVSRTKFFEKALHELREKCVNDSLRALRTHIHLCTFCSSN